MSKILIVEDDAVGRELAKVLLERRGHVIVTAGDVPEALAALTRDTFDLVLVDLQIPGGGGLALVEALRARALTKKAIAFTATKLDDAEVEAMGFGGKVDKPIDPRTFAVAVETYANKPSGTWNRPALEKRLIALKERYIAELPKAVDRIELAIKEERWDEAASEAHRLVGTGASFGLAAVTDAAREIERALRGRDGQTLESILVEVRTRLQDIVTIGASDPLSRR